MTTSAPNSPTLANFGATGGGGGGTIANTDVAADGAAAGNWVITTSNLGVSVVSSMPSGGATATLVGNPGADGFAVPMFTFVGTGGAGGGATTDPLSAAGKGGDGVRGGGGGGGGAATYSTGNASTSGAGGKGGDGYVALILYW